jgi:hypothetical protein
MFTMTVNDFLLTMAICLLAGGMIMLAVGVFIMVKKLMGKELQTIAEQTTKLAQKGIADDISGLVGNAGSLIESLNNLTKTTAGIGVLIVLIALALLGGAYALVLHIG